MAADVVTTHAAAQAGVGPECLRVKPGQEILASRFETRRYLAMLGGTTEWSKMEGALLHSCLPSLCSVCLRSFPIRTASQELPMYS